jgi:hypothetical protein
LRRQKFKRNHSPNGGRQKNAAYWRPTWRDPRALHQ